jgi:dolichyl-phosphate-mannose--protein O-mannosyl transferase
MATQNFENHTKFVPPFHIGVLGIFAANLIWSGWRLVQGFSAERVFGLLLAIAFVLGALYGRMFAMTVQDRVIRLEMRLRLERLLAADLRSRIPEFSVGQLVALRFASDAELPELARKVLDGKIEDRKAIKRMVRDWQADWLRA